MSEVTYRFQQHQAGLISLPELRSFIDLANMGSDTTTWSVSRGGERLYANGRIIA